MMGYDQTALQPILTLNHQVYIREFLFFAADFKPR